MRTWRSVWLESHEHKFGNHRHTYNQKFFVGELSLRLKKSLHLKSKIFAYFDEFFWKIILWKVKILPILISKAT